MNETPEKLRLMAAYYRERDDVGDEGTAHEFDAAASAWEADLKRLEITDAAMNNLARKLTTADIRIEALEKAHNAAEAWGEAISVWGPHDDRTIAALTAWDRARVALAQEKKT